jgi:hypothetical protein
MRFRLCGVKRFRPVHRPRVRRGPILFADGPVTACRRTVWSQADASTARSIPACNSWPPWGRPWARLRDTRRPPILGRVLPVAHSDTRPAGVAGLLLDQGPAARLRDKSELRRDNHLDAAQEEFEVATTRPRAPNEVPRLAGDCCDPRHGARHGGDDARHRARGLRWAAHRLRLSLGRRPPTRPVGTTASRSAAGPEALLGNPRGPRATARLG